MGRLSDRHIVQLVDDESIVFMDQSTGAEVAIPADAVDPLIDLLVYFRLSLRATEDGRRRASRVAALVAEDQRVILETDDRIQHRDRTTAAVAEDIRRTDQ